MISLKINNLSFLVKDKISVLEACKYVGIDIPRFCYHESLSISGNCRMCLIELEKSPKPVASCVLPVINNMQIFVNTPLVKKARENVLEILLLNHPLDCPICDQAGECDLQDQVKIFGGDYSRFFFTKRGVEDKNCGPLIKTIMTRCIHCTRCVRFGSEIAGVDYLGTLNRGEQTEIGAYVQSFFDSEISGNVIDLCPVGALTSKPYSFKSRPWELRTSESIDFTDSTGSNIYINFKETEIYRVLPKCNNEINESIITDKIRFSYDSLKKNRLKFIFKKTNHKFEIVNWVSFFEKVDSLIKEKKSILILINEDLSLENLQILKLFENYFGKKIKVKRLVASNTNYKNFYSNYSNENGIQSLNNDFKDCFILSSNFRLESAIINAKIRVKYINKNFSAYTLGFQYKSNFLNKSIFLSSNNILNFIEGKSLNFSKLILKKNIAFFLGVNLLSRGCDSEFLKQFIKKINISSIIIDIKESCNTVGNEFIFNSFVSASDFENSEALFCLNIKDNFFLRSYSKNYKGNIFWFNSYVSSFKKADILVPVSNHLETEETFLNLEKRPQKSLKVLPSINDSRSLNKILHAILNTTFKGRFKHVKYLEEIILNPNLFKDSKALFLKNLFFKFEKKFISLYPFKPNLENFYKTSNYVSNSTTMNKCSKEQVKKNF
jgi:NADH-quinone oxidoreductase chain G